MSAVHKVKPRDLKPGMRMAQIGPDLEVKWVRVYAVHRQHDTANRYRIELEGDPKPLFVHSRQEIEIQPVPLTEVLAAETLDLQASVLLDPPQASVTLADLGRTSHPARKDSPYWHTRLAVRALERLYDFGQDAPDLRGHTITVTISADGTTATATDITPAS